MDIKQLGNIYTLSVEVERIEEELSTLEHEEAQPNVIEAYRQVLKDHRTEVLAKKIEAEQFLSQIDDDEIRLIAKMRFIDLKTWSQSAKKLCYDRTAPYDKWKTYLRKHKIK